MPKKPVPSTTMTSIPKQLVDPISTKMEAEYKKLLGVDVLPQAVKIKIQNSSQEAATRLLDLNMSQDAMKFGKDMFRPTDHAALIEQRLGSALQGVMLVSQNDDLKQMIDENAKILKMKMDALVTAGFKEEQAFQLILAEVAAKKSK